MNPKIYETKLPNKIKGIYYKGKNETFILVNKNLKSNEKICTIVEELIHHKYFSNANYYSCKNYYQIEHINWVEVKVKKLVAELLIPDVVLETFVLPYMDKALKEIAEEINVTEEILKIRLEIYKNEEN